MIHNGFQKCCIRNIKYEDNLGVSNLCRAAGNAPENQKPAVCFVVVEGGGVGGGANKPILISRPQEKISYDLLPTIKYRVRKEFVIAPPSLIRAKETTLECPSAILQKWVYMYILYVYIMCAYQRPKDWCQVPISSAPKSISTNFSPNLHSGPLS